MLTPIQPRVLTGEELVRLKAPHVATMFWTYFGVVVGIGVVDFLFFHDSRPDLQLFLAEVAVLAVTCWFASQYYKSLAVQIKNVGFDHWEAYFGLSLLIPLMFLNYGYHGLLSRLMSDRPTDPLSGLRMAGVSEGTLILAFCVLPAISEELAYRGLIQHWLQIAIAPWHAIAVAAFLFAITHLSIISLPYLFLLGLLLGWTKLRTGSLYPSMSIHFLHNWLVLQLSSFV